jgi:hypothetical protein
MSTILFNYEDDNKMDKYGDDNKFESWTDINIFFPIATKMVDPLHCMKLTPNMITILSTLFTFLSIYFIHINNKLFAFVSYIFGYILDCVDGRLARKYSLGSELGMVLDCTSDNISNFLLFSYILLTKPINKITLTFISIVIIMSYLLSLSYGINEAILSKKDINNDNFKERREKQFENKEYGILTPLYKLYLFITNISYSTYRRHFTEYNEEKITKWLKILKHFGPGNYCLIIGLLLFII